jgi:hypothetical protein
MSGQVNGKPVEFAPQLPTRAEFDAAPPRQQCYMSYTYAAWPESTIPARCPYKVGTEERAEWNRGADAAMLDAQDGDDE